MEKIAYLFGTGATQAEIFYSGWPGSVLMSSINQNVYKKSKNRNGKYAELIEELSISPDDIDIEQIISLFEDFDESGNKRFKKLISEVREIFHSVVLENLLNNSVYAPSKIATSLFLLYKKYSSMIGKDGEELTGVLTINFDSNLENAFLKSYNGINYSMDIKYKDFKYNDTCPPLLKLHGSFNWRGNDPIIASPEFEFKKPDDESRWLRPSVFKKPVSIYQKLWNNASKILLNSDVLRIIGCSLRSEDWALISLIFQSQIQSNGSFRIELILPEDSSQDIRQRLPFLSKVKPITEIYRTDFDMNNVFKSFVLQKLNEAMEKDSTIKDDSELKEILE